MNWLSRHTKRAEGKISGGVQKAGAFERRIEERADIGRKQYGKWGRTLETYVIVALRGRKFGQDERGTRARVDNDKEKKSLRRILVNGMGSRAEKH